MNFLSQYCRAVITIRYGGDYGRPQCSDFYFSVAVWRLLKKSFEKVKAGKYIEFVP